MKDDKTFKLMSILNSIDDESNLDDYLTNIDKFIDLGLPKYFNDICIEKNIKKSDLIRRSDINRTYAYQILKGDKKPSRDKILQLCIGASLNIEETQKALKLGNVGELYPKIQRDSIIIFAINKGVSIMDLNDLLYEYNLHILGEDDI